MSLALCLASLPLRSDSSLARARGLSLPVGDIERREREGQIRGRSRGRGKDDLIGMLKLRLSWEIAHFDGFARTASSAR